MAYFFARAFIVYTAQFLASTREAGVTRAARSVGIVELSALFAFFVERITHGSRYFCLAGSIVLAKAKLPVAREALATLTVFGAQTTASVLKTNAPILAAAVLPLYVGFG